MRLICLITLSLLGYCKDETVSGYAGTETIWLLQSIDEASFPARATLTFPEEGRIAGDGPCNRFFATQTVPYPWFEIGPIGSTKRACPALAAEQAYFKALANMTLAEVAGTTLILSNPDGGQMVFTAN
ncbi:heat shock protein HslJ [Litoreibacter ponti]|uniref:Heat shock protein HslJ n=1 Tax=Litoreibacter ponti TaxID=1510457 RepID=A0A2T6BML2_9RHOB|nr:META domain-containing protein [Litoreibacter ponti]PTX57292.1 heat shock protein HslJ [Litoreibacter ponti]